MLSLECGVALMRHVALVSAGELAALGVIEYGSTVRPIVVDNAEVGLSAASIN